LLFYVDISAARKLFPVRMSQKFSKSVQPFQSYRHLNLTLEFNGFGSLGFGSNQVA